MLSRHTTICNKLGLHARAASKLVATASAYACKVEVEFGDKRVDGKSIMSVMLLAAAIGAEIILHCDGHDEHEAMEALLALINDKFGEGE